MMNIHPALLPSFGWKGLNAKYVHEAVLEYGVKLTGCTAAGVVELLDQYGVGIEGKNVVIIGRSDLVGKPLWKLLSDRNATPVCCHRATRDLLDRIREADVVVSAAGRPPELCKEDAFRLTASMIKEGVVVVGVGARKDPVSGKLHFDVDFDGVESKASFITPNLKGVGLMTRGRLLWNTILTTHGLEKSLLNPY